MRASSASVRVLRKDNFILFPPHISIFFREMGGRVWNPAYAYIQRRIIRLLVEYRVNDVMPIIYHCRDN